MAAAAVIVRHRVPREADLIADKARSALGLAMALCCSLPFLYGLLFEAQFLWIGDDQRHHAQHGRIKSFSMESVIGCFRGGVNGETYEPFFNILQMAIVAAAGGNCRSVLTVSIVLHALCAQQLFLATVSILHVMRPQQTAAVTLRAAFCGVLLYAIHPLRVEVVAWASCQAYLLASLFLVVSVRCIMQHLTAEAGATLLWYLLGLMAYIAACLSKAVAIPGGFALLLLDIVVRPPAGLRSGDDEEGWVAPMVRDLMHSTAPSATRGAAPRRFFWRALALRCVKYAPFLLVAALSARTVPSGHGEALDEAATLNKQDALRRSALSMVLPLKHTLFPLRLAALYPYPTGGFCHWSYALLVCGVLLAAGACLSRLAIKSRLPLGLAAALLCYCAFVLPTLFEASSHPTLTADRHAHLSTICFAPLAAALFARLLRARSAPGVAAAAKGLALGLVALLCMQTALGVRRFSSAERLWRSVVDAQPDNYVGYVNLRAALLAPEGRLASDVLEGEDAQRTSRVLLSLAAERLDSAVQLNPIYNRNATSRAIAWLDNGVLLAEGGAHDGAAEAFRKAFAEGPDLRSVLTASLADGGMSGEVRKAYEEAMHHPGHANAPAPVS